MIHIFLPSLRSSMTRYHYHLKYSMLYYHHCLLCNIYCYTTTTTIVTTTFILSEIKTKTKAPKIPSTLSETTTTITWKHHYRHEIPISQNHSKKRVWSIRIQNEGFSILLFKICKGFLEDKFLISHMKLFVSLTIAEFVVWQRSGRKK